MLAEHTSLNSRSSAKNPRFLDDGPASNPAGNAADESCHVLRELPVDCYQNEAAVNSGVNIVLAAHARDHPPASSAKQAVLDVPVRDQNVHPRRAPIQLENFELLDTVEEKSIPSDARLAIALKSRSLGEKGESTSLSQGDGCLEDHPLHNAEPHQPLTEIEKHLAGQFEWLVSYVHPTSSPERCGSHLDTNESTNQTITFGCNLLSRRPYQRFSTLDEGHCERQIYTMMATPIKGDAHLLPRFEVYAASQGMPGQLLSKPSPNCEAWSMAFHLDPNDTASRAVSPSPSLLSEPTAGGLRTVSYSSSRIEDSLEELDRLEEDLEAVNVVTSPERHGSVKRQSFHSISRQPTNGSKPSASKRVSIAAPLPIVRLHPPDKTGTALRRSSSLNYREKTGEGRKECVEQKVPGSLSRSKSTNLRSAATAPTVKSSKPPTVPNFQLPGEAVARRLKEQREARQAQQAEAQKSHSIPSRSRSNKPLPKPTFELPGEAISRKKREEHEFKLQAQEEEDRRRREFKARPVRYTVGPSTLPRETIASLARQSKLPQQSGADKQAKRVSMAGLKSLLGKSATLDSPVSRGRNSMILPTHDVSRATSTSTGSISGRRSNVSAEDVEKQRVRGKAIFTQDNSYTQQKDRERTKREMIAKKAREEAAERSRMASREWAEKRKRC